MISNFLENFDTSLKFQSLILTTVFINSTFQKDILQYCLSRNILYTCIISSKKNFFVIFKQTSKYYLFEKFFLYYIERRIFIVYKKKNKYYVIEIDARRQINLSC